MRNELRRYAARLIWATWLTASLGIGALTAIGCGDISPTAPTPAAVAPLPVSATFVGPLTGCPAGRICAN